MTEKVPRLVSGKESIRILLGGEGREYSSGAYLLDAYFQESSRTAGSTLCSDVTHVR